MTGTYDSVAGGASSNFGGTHPNVDTSGKAKNNALTVESGGIVTGVAYGGLAGGSSTVATGNSLTIKGTVKEALGAYSGDGPATGNFVFIDGGTVGGEVIGGFANGGPAEDNTVTLISGTVLGYVLGGTSSDCSTYACVSNTLAVKGKDFRVGWQVSRFAHLAFTLPAGIAAGDTMLKVGDGAAFPKPGSTDTTEVKIAMADGAKLKQGESVTLIEANTNGGSAILEIIPASTTVTTADGYTFELTKDGNKLIAEVIKVTYTINATATPAEGGSISCDPTEVEDGSGKTVTCTVTVKEGYEVSSFSVSGGGASLDQSGCGDPCVLKNIGGNVDVSVEFTETGGGGGSFAPAVLSIDGDTSNKNRLQPGKANKVKFTLGNSSFNGDGTLRGVPKSLQKASLGSETVSIKNGEFEADITPEEGEKTVTVNLTVKDTPVNQDFTFKVAGSGGGAVTGGPSPVPTMSEIGLLLSGIALAGAAAPALRRRERKERKQ